MARGRDDRHHPNRKVERKDNVYFVNFDPRQNHPAYRAQQERKGNDDAPPKGMKRPDTSHIPEED